MVVVKLLITGICGFVGSSLARVLKQYEPDLEILGIDNLARAGSHLNKEALSQLSIRVFHGDLRMASDLDALPAVDWIIDAAANPSVLAGVDGKTSSRQLVEHNLVGTINVLEYAARHRSGLILISSSRVYSIAELSRIPLHNKDGAFQVATGEPLPEYVSSEGVQERFSTEAPVSLYGSTKLASEVLALEYGHTFELPIWINRCGVLAGAGQFGRPDQGIFTFWINSYLRKQPLKYIGFGGTGAQVRDCLHPRDLVPLLLAQMKSPDDRRDRLIHASGGRENSMSLQQLSHWCRQRFGQTPVDSYPNSRQFDVPWLILDSALAKSIWDWQPQTTIYSILEEIAEHAEANPDWLKISNT
jgi:CDP-paratose 2-epimerase